jgi:hypothetical protein
VKFVNLGTTTHMVTAIVVHPDVAIVTIIIPALLVRMDITCLITHLPAF